MKHAIDKEKLTNTVCCVLLEYCGGERTDSLYEKFAKWNPDYTIHVLDNASPAHKCKYITHQNEVNSGVGGGIIDSLQIAREQGARYLFVITNDVIPLTPVKVRYFEEILLKAPDMVQLSASITANSDQGVLYPWMINKGEFKNRIVPHSDIVCCALSINFIDSFGGFPVSRSGWGYDWEIAHHAKMRNKQIGVSDLFTIDHMNEPGKMESEVICEKQRELEQLYDAKYGSYKQLLVNFFTA